MERRESFTPQPEGAEEELELSEEELLKATHTINLPASTKEEEVGEAYFRLRLAQEGPANPKLDKSLSREERDSKREEIEKSKQEYLEQWSDPSFREAEYAKYNWVGEKIRKSAKKPRKPDEEDAQIPELAQAEESREKYNEKKEINFKNIAELSEEDIERIKAVIEKSLGVVVHGEKNKNKKSEFYDEAYVKPDFDARMSAYLLQNMAAGKTEWSVSRAVNKGAHIKGAINLDTGERPGGITIDFENGTIFIDHHGEKEDDPTSAAKITYELLDKLGKLKLETQDGKEVPKEVIEKIINFSVENDNLDYPIDEKFYKETWWQTLYAGKVYEKMPIDKVIEFFQEGNDPRSPLPEKYRNIEIREPSSNKDKDGNRIFKTKKIGELLEQERADMEKAIEGIRENEREMAELKKKGEEFAGRPFDNNTPELGKFLFNRMPSVGTAKYPRFEMRIPPNQTMIAARALGGYNTVIGWNELNKSIRVESDKDVYPLFQRLEGILPGIKPIRGRMIIDGLTGDYKDTQKRDAKTTDVLSAVFSYEEPNGNKPKQNAPGRADNATEDERNRQKEEKERKDREAQEQKNREYVANLSQKLGYPSGLTAKEVTERRAKELGVDLSKVSPLPGADWFAIRGAIAEKIGVKDVKSLDPEDFNVPINWIDDFLKPDLDLTKLDPKEAAWLKAPKIKSLRQKLGYENPANKKDIFNLDQYIKEIESALADGKKNKVTINLPSNDLGLIKALQDRLEQEGFIHNGVGINPFKKGATVKGIQRIKPKK